MDNAYSAELIVESSLEAGQSGMAFAIRLPWYRALPLSVVDVPWLALDGNVVPRTAVRFEVNGRSFTLDELAQQTGEYWYVLDDARIRVSGVQVRAGGQHQLELQVDLHPPYIPHFVWVTRASKTLRAGDGKGGVQ